MNSLINNFTLLVVTVTDEHFATLFGLKTIFSGIEYFHVLEYIRFQERDKLVICPRHQCKSIKFVFFQEPENSKRKEIKFH